MTRHRGEKILLANLTIHVSSFSTNGEVKKNTRLIGKYVFFSAFFTWSFCSAMWCFVIVNGITIII